ncbi:uncharacterized protein CEXT_242221 [Caerostris extrusa]|uniref:Uncharacterized protein n=1 Tax=Caerostris extrusa TaxID=172846 RepID=A0AAV4UH49_CAEEX|nr:uncharacterized protein CEXT_242221 [Caerostris extrusa]
MSHDVFRECVHDQNRAVGFHRKFPQPTGGGRKYEGVQRYRTQGLHGRPCNTDQAWKEVELWHIHYDTTENVSEKLQHSMGWRLITEDAFFKLPAGQAVLLQDIARKMKATIL